MNHNEFENQQFILLFMNSQNWDELPSQWMNELVKRGSPAQQQPRSSPVPHLWMSVAARTGPAQSHPQSAARYEAQSTLTNLKLE